MVSPAHLTGSRDRWQTIKDKDKTGVVNLDRHFDVDSRSSHKGNALNSQDMNISWVPVEVFKKLTYSIQLSDGDWLGSHYEQSQTDKIMLH